MVDISILVAIVGACVSAATFFIGRQTAARSDGRETGALVTDLKYIKESVERIEERLNDDIKRLEGRIDEISMQMANVTGTATKAYESAKSCHKRVDEHLSHTHGQTVVRRDDI